MSPTEQDRLTAAASSQSTDTGGGAARPAAMLRVEGDSGANPTAGSGGSPLLRVRGLTKVFVHGGRRLDVLCGIDLDVGTGEMLAIVGASGAGKSTLLHILGTLDRPTAGQIGFGSRQLERMSQAQLAAFRNKTIGFVFQFHHLLPEFTAIENVMMPRLITRAPRQESQDRAAELLQAVGLDRRMTHRPGELSGGEQQRVALARALVMQPRLLLADEPTGNLDSKTGQMMHELFVALNEQFDTTMLMVTHNHDLARRIPRRLEMVDGRLCDLGVGA